MARTPGSGFVTEAMLEDALSDIGTPEPGAIIQVGGTKPSSGWWLDTGGTYNPPPPPPPGDTTLPTAGTLDVLVTSSTATLTVTGAQDETALHAYPYAFSRDNGQTWTTWQSDPTYVYTDLASAATYPFRHKVRDAAGNERTGTVVVKETPEAASPFRDAILALGPTLYYPLDEASSPPGGSTGYRNLGSNTAGLTTAYGTPGGAGIGDGNHAMTFASGQTARFSRNLVNGAATWTLMALVDIESSSGQIIGGDWNSMQFQANTDTGTATAWVKSTNLNATVPTPFTGTHLIVMTYDGTTARAYWDGQQVGSAAIAAYTLAIGVDLGFGDKLVGRGSSLTFWKDTALTATQVQGLHDALTTTP